MSDDRAGAVALERRDEKLVYDMKALKEKQNGATIRVLNSFGMMRHHESRGGLCDS